MTSGHTATCTSAASTNLQLTFGAASTTQIVQGKITFFHNPYSTRAVTIKIGYAVGCGTTMLNERTTTNSFTAGSLTTVTLSSNSNLVGDTNCVLTVSFNPATVLKPIGMIELEVPAWYSTPDGDSSDSVLSISSKVTSTSLTITSDPQFFSSTRTISFSFSTTTTITSATSVSFQISNFNNPINNQDKSGFLLKTNDFQGTPIDTTASATGFTFARVSSAASLSAVSVQILNSAGTVDYTIAQTARTLKITFTLTLPIEQNCYVTIVFPDDIKIDVDATMNTYIGQGLMIGANLDGSYPAIDVTKKSYTSGNQLQFAACKDTNYLGPNQQAVIMMSKIVSPNQLKDTGSFQITVSEDDAMSILIAQTTTGIFIQKNSMTGGTISSMSMAPVLFNTVQTATDYKFVFTLSNNLHYDSRISIKLPSLITGLGTACSIMSKSTNINGLSPVCTTTTATNTINIDNPFLTNSAASWDYIVADSLGTITLQINGATNQISARDAGAWTVTSYNLIGGAYYVVDTGTSTTSFTAVSGALTSSGSSLTINNFVTYSDSGLYIFQVKMSHNIPAYGFASVILPSTLSISSASKVRASCYYGTSNVQQTCSLSTTNSQQINMQIIAGHLASATLQMSFNGIRNPRTTAASSSFTVQTTDRDLYAIDKSSLFTVTMSTPGNLDDISLNMLNTTNGARTTYLVSFSTSIPISSGDIMYITFASAVTFSSSNPVSCTAVSQISTISCSVSSQVLTVYLTSVSSTTGNFQFNIVNATNPPSTRLYTVLSSVLFTDSSGNSIMSMPSSKVVTLQTTLPANILKYSVTQGRTDLGQTTNYNLIFTPTNKISKDGAIIVTWPTQVSMSSGVSCSVLTDSQYSSVCAIDTTKRQISITKVFGNAGSSGYTSSITVQLSPVTNPKDNRILNGFTITTYDDVAFTYKNDILADNLMLPNTPCVFPCKTCSATNTSQCATCWSEYGYTYLQKVGNYQTCSQSCNSGYSSNGDSGKVCVTCDSSCSTCVDSAKANDKYRCITCATGYNYRYPPDQKCMKLCESGYYEASSYVCDLCKTPCKECSAAATSCTDCFNTSSNPFLYDSTCTNSCPVGYVGIGSKCEKCELPCVSCLNNTSTCTSCDPSGINKYLYGYACVATCPNGTQANEATLKCVGCPKGCKLCDSLNQTNCIQCEVGLLQFQGQCLKECPSGFKVSFFGTACVSSIFLNLPMLPFPFLIAAFVALIFCFISYLKDKKTYILTNVIAFWGPIEFVSYLAQTAFCFMFATYKYAGMSAVGAISYLILNLAFTLSFYFKVARKDEEFRGWRTLHKKTYTTIMVFSGLLSFKILRLFYSDLFGWESYSADFTNPGVFQRQIILFTILHFIFSNCVILGVDVVGLIYIGWGNQLFITMIETSLMALVMVILSFIEMCKLKDRIDDDTPSYKQVNFDSVMNASQMDDIMDKKQREDMLKKIMQHVRGNKDLYLNNNLDELLGENGLRKCKSMIAFENEREEDPRQTRSFPSSPRNKDDVKYFDKEAYLNSLHQDNVYAESKPANPLGRAGKTYTDAGGQALPYDIDKIFERKGGDFVNFDQNADARKRDKKSRRRGRKNQYYTQIDAEDDEEADNMDNDDGQRLDTSDNLDIIREEDEDEQLKQTLEKKRQKDLEEQRKKEMEDKIKQEKEEQQKQYEEQARLQREQEASMAKQKEQQAREEAAKKELADKEKQQQELFETEKAVGESAMPQTVSDDQSVQMNQQTLKDQFQQEEPEVQVPPDAQKRNFNENDILGDFDRDDKGNVIVLQDENGNYVDKQGRRVNERGYLMDEQTGDIIENQQKQKMFAHQDMDERGDIPAPFCVERYNFNPFNIRGEFDLDRQGRPILNKNKRGELVDKRGRLVNKRGWLVDAQGNVVDKQGRKKFDKKQLTQDGDMPKLFNYGGRRFDVNDVCGQFERDKEGNIKIKKNKQGQSVDERGRLVNERGYLVDESGNVVDKEGKKIFEKRYLKNGEFPKVLPFTKFNLKKVQGNYEMDPLGNPILDRDAQGVLIDRDGKRVNQKGYLVDEEGNVIDRNGKKMFDKEILDEEGEIPKVFRTGLLKSDTGSDLSRLMSEIEKNQPTEQYANEDRKVQNELKKLQNKKGKHSGNTSVDSMMEDTPSNYNLANQRFEVHNTSAPLVDQIEEEEESQYEVDMTTDNGKLKKRRVKKKKKVVQAFNEPSDKDLQMAKAYGGPARGPPKRGPPKANARMVNTPGTTQHRDHSKLNRVAGSVSGFQQDNSGRHQEEYKRDQFRDPGTITHHSNFLNETNDPSFMAVPEHHIREQRLKQKKMNEAKRRAHSKRMKGNNGGDADFEKMFGKDIDEFLEDSDWDIESFENMSNYSKGTSRSAFGDGRLRGLESIYLQRIETSMKKGGKARQKAKKPKFRALQDRFVDDPQFIHDGEENDASSQVSKVKSNRNRFVESVNSTSIVHDNNVVKKGQKEVEFRKGPDYTKKYIP